MIFRGLWLAAMVAVLFTGCKKKEEKTGTLQINLSYKADNKTLQFDTMDYHCQAGYRYEVTRLNYYLSGFVFTKTDGSQTQSDKVFYIDAAQSATNTLMFENFTPAGYTRVNFYLGLDSMKNMTGMLPVTTDNINMAWPDLMGGGYHFLRLEGHYQDTTGTYGFAMHMGKNNNLVRLQADRLFSIDGSNTAQINLAMNINEWFRNPEVYDFNTDGNFSMSSDAAMHKLCTNGTDIFN